MRMLLLVTCCAATLPGAAFAAVAVPLPACALHLAESPVGGVLTQEQIDTNNSCIMTLQQDTAVAEAAAKIEEANRRAAGKSDKPDSPVRGYPPPASPIMVTPQPMAPQPHRDPAPRPRPDAAPTPVPAQVVTPPQPPPVVDGIMWDGSTYSADLIFPDGGSMEVRRGTTLPDGSSVVIVSQGGVYTQADGTIRPLRFESGETPAPAASSTPARRPAPSAPPVPSMPSSYPVMH